MKNENSLTTVHYKRRKITVTNFMIEFYRNIREGVGHHYSISLKIYHPAFCVIGRRVHPEPNGHVCRGIPALIRRTL